MMQIYGYLRNCYYFYNGTNECSCKDVMQLKLCKVVIIAARNYGYAKFASEESAMKAIRILHGQNVGGNRLKVIEAEPTRHEDRPSRNDFDDEPYKKQRT